jgi:hypothetical protein
MRKFKNISVSEAIKTKNVLLPQLSKIEQVVFESVESYDPSLLSVVTIDVQFEKVKSVKEKMYCFVPPLHTHHYHPAALTEHSTDRLYLIKCNHQRIVQGLLMVFIFLSIYTTTYVLFMMLFDLVATSTNIKSKVLFSIKPVETMRQTIDFSDITIITP